jgi:hypothetical protein
MAKKTPTEKTTACLGPTSRVEQKPCLANQQAAPGPIPGLKSMRFGAVFRFALPFSRARLAGAIQKHAVQSMFVEKQALAGGIIMLDFVEQQ